MSERFGNYELLEQLAAGGMARVFRARMVGAAGFEKIVAIKLMLPSFARDPEAVKMFIDEARLAATLSHANIVGILDFGEKNGEYYLAMEYVAGANLRVLLRRSAETERAVPVTTAARIAAEVALGLDYAHKKTDANGNPLSIVHRDVSPQNIVVSWTGEVKILDFGIARSTNRSIATAVGTIKGKYSYMSPEQARGDAIDHRSDIFSLGSVFYELLCGERAFPNPGIEILEKVRNAEFVPLLERKPDVPAKLAEVVTRAMAANPLDRYPTAGAMVEELALWLAEARVRGEKGGDAAALAKWANDLFEASGKDLSAASAGKNAAPADGAPADPAAASAVLSGWEAAFPEREVLATPGGSKHGDFTFTSSDDSADSAADGTMISRENLPHRENGPFGDVEEAVPTREIGTSSTAPHPAATETPPDFSSGAAVTAPSPASRRPAPADPSARRADPPRPDFAAVAREIGKPLPPRAPVPRSTPQPADDLWNNRGAGGSDSRAPLFLAIGGGALALAAIGIVGAWIVVSRPPDLAPPTPTPTQVARATPSPIATAAMTATATSTPEELAEASPTETPAVMVKPIRAEDYAKPIGIMNISSVPPGADVLVDGRRISLSPVLIPDLLAPATYLVEVNKEGYAPWSREIDLQDDNAVEVVAELKTPEVPGKLVMTLPSGVRCFIDGHLAGTGPKRIAEDVQPGTRQVKLRSSDGTVLRDYEVLITSGHDSEIDVPRTL